jgi:hypothetical protein
MHAQWKRMLDNHLIPLIEAPSFFRRTMLNRQLNRDQTLLAPKTRISTSSLQEDARSKGYGSLVDKAKVHLSDVASSRLCRELTLASGMYVISKLSSRDSVNEAIAGAYKRGASAERFKVLADKYFDLWSESTQVTSAIIQ